MNSKQQAYVNDVMANITNTVIEAIQNGTAPWQKPWADRGNTNDPVNLSTGNAYQGLNAIYLSMLSSVHGSPYWLGFGQCKKLGGHVRKGEKGTAILRPLMRKYKDDDDNEKMYCAGFAVVKVWNAAQCDNLELPEVDEGEAERTLDAAMLDIFAENTGADIRHGGNSACFIPSVDQVHMPNKDQFETEGGYYGTLLHELTHWTGHKSRLNRLKSARFGSRDYAFEELVAELGAYYASEKIGCPNEADNHASYLESWLKALKDDPKYLWDAASLAQRAADYMIELHDKAEDAKRKAKRAAA